MASPEHAQDCYTVADGRQGALPPLKSHLLATKLDRITEKEEKTTDKGTRSILEMTFAGQESDLGEQMQLMDNRSGAESPVTKVRLPAMKCDLSTSN